MAEEKKHKAHVDDSQVREGTDGGAGLGRRWRRRRRKDKAQEDTSQVSQVELARRQRQKKLRTLALHVREQGQVYNPKRHKKHKPRRRVACIIIPIFWNKKVGEKNSVLEAAKKIQELLRGAGVKCDADTTNELTPGQKMRHWEEKGVMLRVEVGAKEVNAGAAVVARCTTPGEVAQKQAVAMGEPLLQLVKSHLEELGIPLQPSAAGQPTGAAEAEEAAEGALEGEQQRPEGDQARAQQQAQQEEGAEKHSKKKKAQGPSGDDLVGDFAAVPLLPQQATGRKGKQQKQAAAAAAAELAASVFGQAGEDQEQQEKKKKKKHKTVKF